MKTTFLVEVCGSSIEDVEAANLSGAHRIELNSGLPLGGLTPSLGLLKSAISCSQVPVICMIRPREGGFRYSTREFEVMRRDIECFLEAGAAGIAIGLLDSEGGIDLQRCQLVRKIAGPADVVFHRAFDFAVDPVSALESVIRCGFNRVMTSGGAESAISGARAIAELSRRAGDRIEILAAGGILPKSIAQLARISGVKQFHGSFSAPRIDPSGKGPVDLQPGSHSQTEFRRADTALITSAIVALANLTTND